jgi:hypothetical protein
VKRPSSTTLVAVGTTDGGFLFSSNPDRSTWKKSPKFLKGESVNSFAYNQDSGTLFAATHTEGVFKSNDRGRTWKPSSRGLNVKKVWTLEVDPRDSDTMYAGTHYGHLFRSEDSGRNWSEVVGLHSAPNRNNWGIDWANGTTGLCIHTIRMDPRDKNRIYLVASGNGTYRSDDRGATWKRLQEGVADGCPVFSGPDAPNLTGEAPEKQLADHLRDVHGCTHKIAISTAKPGTIYQQNHCGVFESGNSGDRWADVSAANEVRHGFPMVLTEDGSAFIFTVPAYQGICKKHNSCIKGQLAVYRREGQKWDRLTDGLPKGVHTCVLRDAMATDARKEPGVYFGTTTGEVFGSLDSGESWFQMMRGAGRVQGVNSFSA